MQKFSDRLLLIFIKNPEEGAVKARLAVTLGDEKMVYVIRLLTGAARFH